jgi:geranylgeranyl diphosphate synthase type I
MPVSRLAPTRPELDDDFATGLQGVLTEHLAGKQRQYELIGAEAGALAAQLSRFVLDGGKRLRPTFAWWGWRGAAADGREGVTAVLRAVAALELLQAAALIHDDIVDRSTTRRGRPTAHVELASAHRAAGWFGDSDRFGVAGAILLGDIALTCADDMLRDAGLRPDALRRAAPIWTQMRTELLGGQYLDLCTQAAGDDSEESALRVALFKSAAYTVVRPLQLGAAIAGAGEPLMSGYHKFGTDVGVAFQLRDDLLGVFGDPAVTGKPAGEDLREGKRTLLVALALRTAADRGAAGDAAARAIRHTFGLRELSSDELESARAALVDLGAVEAVERRIATLTEAALDTVRVLPAEPLAASRLAELALAATRRNS